MRAGYAVIAVIIGLTVSAGTAPPAVAQTSLTYFAPGNILPNADLGVRGRKVFFPDWTFPLEVGTATGKHAYIGTQLEVYHHVHDVNSPTLFNYPHRDNQCEPRGWRMLPCPSGNGHQGVDIRADDNRNNFWPVVAVESGVVSSVTANTTVAVRNGSHTVRYLHMDPGSIAAAGIRAGVTVTQGQMLGKVSCFLERRCQTSRHVHLDAYTGSAGNGDFYHVYPSLIAAYRRAWGLPSGIADGALGVDTAHEVGGSSPPPFPSGEGSCNGVSLSEPLPGADLNSFDSLWRHNCSVMGLKVDPNSGARSFTYYRPKRSLGDVILGDPVLFEGVNASGRFSGVAKQYSSLCGIQKFDVEGEAAEENGTAIVRLKGTRQRLDSACQPAGTVDESLKFTFAERVTPSGSSTEHVIPEPRTTLSELTRNFLAITFYPGPTGTIEVLPYFRDFPGTATEGGRTDQNGGLIPALASDEAGVAISRVWVRKRALYTQGLTITPRSVAHSMAGVDPGACDAGLEPTPAGITAAGGNAALARSMCGRVSAYLRGYIGFAGGRSFARDYFGRAVSADETLNLSDMGTAYNWMRTMYSHESGRAPVIDREIFERGVRFGDDYIATYYDHAPAETLHPLAYYSDPCNFSQASCTGTPAGGTGADDDTPAAGGATDAEQLAKITGEVAAIRERLSTIETIVNALSQGAASTASAEGGTP